MRVKMVDIKVTPEMLRADNLSRVYRQLCDLCKAVPPSVAPKLAHRLRLARSSAEGAVRHAENIASRAEGVS